MSAADAIADLDAALDEAAQPVTLRRLVGTGPTASDETFATRAHVRFEALDAVTAGQTQDRLALIMSPSDLGAWGEPVKGQKVIVDGRARNIDAVQPTRMGTTLVRIDLVAIG